ncbi:MAG: dTMP kinase, partial [Firmicutes bacterium]|nr:dTMP kinase [Bacillota bacterium]
GYGRGMDLSLLEKVNGPATGGNAPDLVLLLDIPPDTGRARLQRGGRGKDRIELETVDFHRRVREGYLALALRDRRRYRIIDAAGTPEEVQGLVRAAVMEVLHGYPRAT